MLPGWSAWSEEYVLIYLLENEKLFELKSEGYRDGIKKKRDKIRMGYESLHIMELLSVQCLQVDDVIPILSPC